jgi:hypothetical protein
MTADDCGLGFVANVKDKLELWSRVAGADGDADFVLTRVILIFGKCSLPVHSSRTQLR